MDSKCPGLNDTTPFRNANSHKTNRKKADLWAFLERAVLCPSRPCLRPSLCPTLTYHPRRFLLQTLSPDGCALREMSKETVSPPPHRASKNLHPQSPHSNDYSDITSKTWHLKSENLYFKFGSVIIPAGILESSGNLKRNISARPSPEISISFI